MNRPLWTIFFAIAVVMPATAAPLQLISGLPSSYVPGAEVIFEVTLPSITNLGAYNIDIVLESPSGTPGVDFFFDVAATTVASANYVFSSDVFFFDAVNVEPPDRHRISLTDFDVTGTDVVSGVNDRVASVVFRTSPSFDQPVSVFVDAGALILDTPDVLPTPVDDFVNLQDSISESGTLQVNVVPEPTTGYLLLVAAMLFLFVGQSLGLSGH